jgi:hypothetical protein
VGGALMRPRVLAGVVASALFLATGYGVGRATAAQAKPDRLKTVLAQMDAGSKTFHSAEASIQKQQFEKIVNDTTTESGTTYFLRSGNSIQMGAKFGPPSEQTVEYKNGVGRLYSAGTNHIDTISASGTNKARADTFLTLGFGGSGSDLDKAWEITDQGPEKVKDGNTVVEVEKLDLVSKETSTSFTHITIWLDLARDVTLKQVFFQPSGDTNTVIYSNIRLNQPIDLNAFAIKCKGKCS